MHGLAYQPRLNPTGNSQLTDYWIYLSKNGTSFTPVASGRWPISTATKFAAWPPQSARYVRLEATERSHGAPPAGEINIATTPLTAQP